MLATLTTVKASDSYILITSVTDSFNLQTGLVDLSGSIMEVKADLNIFQRNIMEYILTVYTTELTVEQEFSFYLALSQIDYTAIQLNDFAAFFSTIVFR